MEVEKIDRKCKYYNGGHCKHKLKCKYSHPQENCKKKVRNVIKMHVETDILKYANGIQRVGVGEKTATTYMLLLLAMMNNKKRAHKSYPCAGCKSCFTDVACAMQYFVGNTGFFLCLNCADWIKYKENIITPGWTLFDSNGDLRRDV